MKILTTKSKSSREKLFNAKNKERMKELIRIFEWIEEITVKLELGIVTQDRLKNMNDIQYKNKWQRYLALKSFVEKIIDSILDTHNENMNILDKLAAFKRFIDIY